MDISVFILIVAALVIILFKKLGQPIVLGYLVAGFLVSPHMGYMETLGITPEIEHDIEAAGKIGVAIIMFCLGLEFSFKKLGQMGAAPFIISGLIVFFMIALGHTVGYMLGWSEMDCIFLGGMLSLSSTAIIYKAFDELGLSGQPYTSKVMSVLILEDIIGVVLLVLLSAKARGVADMSEIMATVVNLGAFVAISLALGLLIVPWFLRMIRPICNSEMLLIVSCALMFGMAWLSQVLGFSEAFGAFIMGSILSETFEAHRIERTVMPLKNYLGAIFFVSVGMLVDVSVLASCWVEIVIFVLTIIIGQMVFGTLSFAIGGQSLRDSFRSGFAMSQIGEFSFIIAGAGVAIKDAATGNPVISENLYPLIVAVSVITTFFTPYMIRAAEPCYNIFAKLVPQTFIEKMEERAKRKGATKKQGGKSSHIGKFANKFFVHAKQQTGNLPRFAGNDITVSEVIVTPDDLFDGSTIKEINSIETNPLRVIAFYNSKGEEMWVNDDAKNLNHVVNAGDKMWCISREDFLHYANIKEA